MILEKYVLLVCTDEIFEVLACAGKINILLQGVLMFFLTLTGTRRGELMGKKSVDWKRPSRVSTVLHFGARWVKGSLGSRAQYLSSKAKVMQRNATLKQINVFAI